MVESWTEKDLFCALREGNDAGELQCLRGLWWIPYTVRAWKTAKVNAKTLHGWWTLLFLYCVKTTFIKISMLFSILSNIKKWGVCIENRLSFVIKYMSMSDDLIQFLKSYSTACSKICNLLEICYQSQSNEIGGKYEKKISVAYKFFSANEICSCIIFYVNLRTYENFSNFH